MRTAFVAMAALGCWVISFGADAQSVRVGATVVKLPTVTTGDTPNPECKLAEGSEIRRTLQPERDGSRWLCLLAGDQLAQFPKFERYLRVGLVTPLPVHLPAWLFLSPAEGAINVTHSIYLGSEQFSRELLDEADLTPVKSMSFGRDQLLRFVARANKSVAIIVSTPNYQRRRVELVGRYLIAIDRLSEEFDVTFRDDSNTILQAAAWLDSALTTLTSEDEDRLKVSLDGRPGLTALANNARNLELRALVRHGRRVFPTPDKCNVQQHNLILMYLDYVDRTLNNDNVQIFFSLFRERNKISAAQLAIALKHCYPKTRQKPALRRDLLGKLPAIARGVLARDLKAPGEANCDRACLDQQEFIDQLKQAS